MIGEFCPKVFALKIHRAFGLKSEVVEFGAEASAGIGTGLRRPALFTA
jgi:hypothetical protein